MSFRTCLAAAALAALAVTPLAAQDLQTPSGPVRIESVDVDGAPVDQMFVGKTPVDFDAPATMVWVQEKVGSLLLVGLSMGGNACPAHFAWVHTAQGDVHASPSFGTCSELVTVSHDAQTVTVTMPSMTPGAGNVSYVYDGHTISEVAVGEVPSGHPPSAGADAWIGQYPYDLLVAAEWRDRFVALMGEADYQRAQQVISLTTPMEVEGDWVAGSGCVQGFCDESDGAVAINRADGRLLVALWTQGSAPRLWGEAQGPLPDKIRPVMAHPG
ncbi:MAG: hypothetical protein GC146_02435 [Limimaricola sp.]|uniref:hypothetical protein n=1 Tax=Limimaricola sp. TaxID=2211665 RepID=UPI001DDE4505|nr:hypothetical protein [Limimaricola sp.]MBI1416057.1 hypothetical protein [Limimaricola sp.]